MEPSKIQPIDEPLQVIDPRDAIIQSLTTKLQLTEAKFEAFLQFYNIDSQLKAFIAQSK